MAMMDGKFQIDAVRHHSEVDPLDDLIRSSASGEHVVTRSFLLTSLLFILWSLLMPFEHKTIVEGNVFSVHSIDSSDAKHPVALNETESTRVLISLPIPEKRTSTSKFFDDLAKHENVVVGRDVLGSQMLGRLEDMQVSSENVPATGLVKMNARISLPDVDALGPGDRIYLHVPSGTRTPVEASSNYLARISTVR